VPCAIIGQAFPYTPIANPRYMVADWAFGIQDENMQKMVNEARGKGVQVVVFISHNGMDVDLKVASRVEGIDAIMGGHTHDGMPVASIISSRVATWCAWGACPTAAVRWRAWANASAICALAAS
jgi:sulfur-oxidizing protein SoxB